MRLFLLLLFLLEMHNAQYVTPQYAQIRAVSAMCSSDGITASIDFDKPFTGKIYSLNYASVDDCLYYNNIDRDTVLFSIPAQLCGTKLQRTTRNMIDQMENRVYVQMDKDTQTASDKQFSFVCRLAEPKKSHDSPTTDSYPTTPADQQIRAVASSVSTKMLTNLTPIKPSEVHQVSAFSRDAHLGNWPIPGSTPYEPSMKPVSSYPLPPITPQLPANALVDRYESRPISAVGHTTLVTPIQRAPPVAARVFTTTIRPTPIVPSVHLRQGVGVPFADPRFPPTKVDADAWNNPNAYVTQPAPTETSPKGVGNPKKEHFLTADAPFSSDTLPTKNVEITESDPPNSHQPPPSILTTTQLNGSIEPEVTLEIQRGEGPFAPPVTTPIKIGDNISLVVKAKSYMNDPTEFDMFVHSCIATDGKGDTKVQIIDEKGCVIRREFASPLHRAKDSDNLMFYYLMIKAFKFPGPDDVYFSCTIEMTPGNRAPGICANTRRSRDTKNETISEIRLFDSVSVHLGGQQDTPKEPLNRSSDAENCESEKNIYIFVIFLLFATITISLSTNFLQFLRSQKSRK